MSENIVIASFEVHAQFFSYTILHVDLQMQAQCTYAIFAIQFTVHVTSCMYTQRSGVPVRTLHSKTAAVVRFLAVTGHSGSNS